MKTFAVRYNWYPFPCYEKAKNKKALRKRLNKEYCKQYKVKSTVKFITIN